MPNTKMTKDKWKNHFAYGKWAYALIAALLIFFGDLAYTMTEPRVSNAQTVIIKLISTYADAEPLNAYAEDALAYAKQYDAGLREVSFQSLMFSGTGDSEMDYYGAQKLMVELVAGDIDLYVCGEDTMNSIVGSDGAFELDKYIANGLLALPEGTRCVSRALTDEETGETGETHIYAISAEKLEKLALAGVEPSESFILLYGTSQNPETSIRALSRLLETLSVGLPEGSAE